MPKRTDIKTILILGAGPIVIGQACEFDYSGTQACKALKEEGYRVVLVNSNPATIMTDPDSADATYIEPLQWKIIAKIIEKEQPDAVLPTMGGQTALNCTLDLDRHGILKQHNIELIGANKQAIDKAEDRQLFDKVIKKIGLETPKAGIAHSMEDAYNVLEEVGFPCIIRPSFTMGGSGGGIAYNKKEFETICTRGLDLSPTNELLIDESLIGWKEFELEVIRDRNDNCIVVCSIENIDPMGIHTGDSITVAPVQTLTDKEYQAMRDAAFAILREIGIETGGSNVQFGLNPENGRIVVIEMNPRVSRSSALASKATGFPIARIATKLSIGYTLDELSNEITGGAIPASFEPTIDYVVTKIPRFAFEKFPQANDRLTTQMKSVGEVMAIGRTFQESLQKALCSLETGANGFNPMVDSSTPDAHATVKAEIAEPGPDRLYYVADAFRLGMSQEDIFAETKIDPWYLAQIEDLINEEKVIATLDINELSAEYLYKIKQKGFSDARIANLMQLREDTIKNKRHQLNILPSFKRVDTCAAEFESKTPYMYSSYDEECESQVTNNKKVVVIGSGPNRIGQGIEFDYCCVHAAMAARSEGYETIMINCNPETVSTDFDTSDRLYFEPITLESVLEIIRIEQPYGVIVHYGGQTPLKLANKLEQAGVRILGTSSDSIDQAEDRERFKQLAIQLQLHQPENSTAVSKDDALKKAENIGYPLVVRPSYVLGGRAMEVVADSHELTRYMQVAVQVSNECPVLLDKFLNRAVEVDIDAICDGKDVFIGAIMQHIEQAGIHSGDSSCVLPPYSLLSKHQNIIRNQVKKMALELKVIGLMNVQMAIQDDEVYIIEVNPRASRTVPFVSKCIGMSLAKLATKVMLGKTLAELGIIEEIKPKFSSVKESVFPFNKFPEVDPILGPEMKSTGEVMGIGSNFAEAFYKAQLAENMELPRCGKAILSVRDIDKPYIASLARMLLQNNFELCATQGTSKVLQQAGLPVTTINKVHEGRPHLVDLIVNGEITFMINTTEGRKAIEDSCMIRHSALENKVPYTTTIASAEAIIQAISFGKENTVRKLQDLHTGK